eukprot:762461-Rhodomonas_salina.1
MPSRPQQELQMTPSSTFAVEEVEATSTSMLAGAAVSWSSTRQTVVALSSSEAEFYAASMCG